MRHLQRSHCGGAAVLAYRMLCIHCGLHQHPQGVCHTAASCSCCQECRCNVCKVGHASATVESHLYWFCRSSMDWNTPGSEDDACTLPPAPSCCMKCWLISAASSGLIGWFGTLRALLAGTVALGVMFSGSSTVALPRCTADSVGTWVVLSP